MLGKRLERFREFRPGDVLVLKKDRSRLVVHAVEDNLEAGVRYIYWRNFSGEIKKAIYSQGDLIGEGWEAYSTVPEIHEDPF